MTTTRKGKSNYRASVAAYFIANPYRVVTRTEMEKELNLTSIQVRGSIAGAQFDARRKGIENWATHLRVEARGVAWMYRPQSTPDAVKPDLADAGTITATPAQVLTAAHPGEVTTGGGTDLRLAGPLPNSITTTTTAVPKRYRVTRSPALGTCLEVVHIAKDGSVILAADDGSVWRVTQPTQLEA